MDFTLSDEQRMTAEVTAALLADRCTGADLRRLMDSGAALDPVRWRALVEMGLPAAMVPESLGGLGLGEVDLTPVAEQCGFAALPEPLVELAGVAAPLLAALDHPAARAWAGRIAAGEAMAAVGHSCQPFVAGADTADVLVLCRPGEILLLNAETVTLGRQPSIDPFHRLFAVAFDGGDAIAAARGPEADRLAALALDRGALFAAAQGIGLAQRAVDLSAAYAKARVQFGKPIGANQAVKHHLASCQVKIEFARPVVLAAAAQIGQQDIYSRARVSHAKLAALAAADLAGRTAIQVHGAMGYSWATDVHVYLKRVLALTGAWGDEAFHRRRVSARIKGRALDPGQVFAVETA